MITKISGAITGKKPHSIFVKVGGFCYEVLIPPAVMKAIEKRETNDGPIDLHTYHYIQTDKSRGMPVLIGFINEIEKEFFTQFISVSGVGPKAACKALSLPFSSIADAIDRADIGLLKTLPGIGERRAREIVAKLQGKIGKFGLIQDKSTGSAPELEEDASLEALSVLMQLQYKRKEAEEMITKALKRDPKIDSCEKILNEVYRQRSK
ncbi:MAG: Holliday junction branch migration protein RuvA [Candidatus Omnitrophota bacterium]